jgi:hypothetical protein
MPAGVMPGAFDPALSAYVTGADATIVQATTHVDTMPLIRIPVLLFTLL